MLCFCCYCCCCYFKQLSLNTKQNFELSCYLIVGKRLLSVVVEVVSFSVNKPLDFQYGLVFLKYNKARGILSKVVLHH